MPSSKPTVARLAAPLVAALLASLAGLPGCAEGCTGGVTGGLCTHEGQPLSLGQRVDKGDGCNTCTCLSNGSVDCTTRACSDDDAGSPGDDPDPIPDAGPDDAGAPRPPSDCVDVDEDGFYTCLDENYPEWPQEVDCDDARWYAQPGGYEFPGNDVDDDCDGEIDEAPSCACVADGNSVGATDLLSAMDLCDDTIVSVTASGDAQQLGVYASYFDDITPQQGGCLGVLSTGVVGATNIESGGSNLCGCGFSSGCDDDPDPEEPGEDVCDLAQVRLTLRPPPNAKGIEFSFMFLSAEWPEFLCTSYNDTFYTLYSSRAVNGGEVSNISFDADQKQITVNVGFFESPREWTVPLDNTPFGNTDSFASCTGSPVDGCTLPDYCDDEHVELDRIGSGSGWLVTRAPFEPGEETIEVVFSIHDEGDGIYDSLVILDGFRWVPYRPPVSTVKE